MPWEIDYKSGVRTDHRGRAYRLMVNSFGRQDKLYIKEDPNAPKAQTIPEPKEPERPKRKMVMTRNAQGESVPVVHKPKRLHVLRARWRGSKEVSELVAQNGNPTMAVKLAELHPFSRSPDCGQTWIPLEPLPCDHHVQYHIDEEVK